MSDDLPKDHDVIVIGTGMTESILAAAFSRTGLRVLHMDMYDNYGSKWGAYNFKTFQQLVMDKNDSPLNFETSQQIDLEDSDVIINLPSSHHLINGPIQFSSLTKDCNFEKIFAACSREENFSFPKITKTDVDKFSIENKITNLSEEVIKTEKDLNNSDEGVLHKETVEKSNVCYETSFEEITDNKEAKKFSHSLQDIGKQWRKFNFDLLPKVLYNKGPLVELLISSDVARYCEFKLLNRILTPLNDQLVPVPSSRSEVFSTEYVSLMDKRQLMKFLTSVSKQPHDIIQNHADKTFKDFLASLNLSETLQHFIHHAIAMVDADASCKEGIEATHRYLDSLGRYDGNSSFLVPLYGTGELLQCFCRLSAVFGGIYCLRRSIASIVIDKDRNIKSVIDSTGQTLTAKWIVMDSSYAPKELFKTQPTNNPLSRAILVTDKSVDPSKKDALTLCNIPGSDKNIIMQEMASSSMICPNDYFVVHLTCRQKENAEKDFENFVSKYFNISQQTENDERPSVIWGCYFSMDSFECQESTVENVVLINGPDAHIDCDESVNEAQKHFTRMYPDLEFLPRAPRPEEIVYAEEEAGGDDSEFQKKLCDNIKREDKEGESDKEGNVMKEGHDDTVVKEHENSLD